MLAWLWPLALYVLVLGLSLAIPGRWVTGYVRDPATGEPLKYRLNGRRVFFVAIGLWLVAVLVFDWPADAFFVHRWQMTIGACALGLLFTLLIVLPARPTGAGLLADLYLGRLDNPQWRGGRLDAKMYLYLAGAIGLELNILSFAAAHIQRHAGAISPGVIVYTALFTFFVVEYLSFEEVHLYTYDFLAEKVGFKLGWGCLCFYPYFYAVGLWALAEAPAPKTPPVLIAIYALIFFAGWVLARGANLQKFHFKRDPRATFLGITPIAILAPGGKQILCSGFWGLSRHINYLGEIAMALGLTLVLGYPGTLWPWLYPLYYVVLLLPRQADDDRRCAAKYGEAWAEYRRRVPARIVPRLY